MMLVILSLAMAIMQPVACSYLDKTLENQPSIPQAFRLLAVEATASEGVLMQSAQYLIKALTRFSNWNNQTYESHIHLLSRYNEDEIINEAKNCWVGNSTKGNVRDEILNFLGSADSNELVVFYCITDGLPFKLYLDEVISASELASWLGTIKGTVCVILDSCHSGSFAYDGQFSMLGSQRIILCSSRSDQSSYGDSDPYWSGDFTGYERVMYYVNQTYMPVGLIGATVAKPDDNGDGWLSAMECFRFANFSLIESWHQQDPVYFNGLGFDPPLVELPSISHDVAVTGIQCKTVTSNSTSAPIKVTVTNQGNSTETFNVTVYINNTSVETQTVNNLLNGSSTNLTFTWNTTGLDYGNYTVNTCATPVQGETDTPDNSFTGWITVTILGDIDGDFKVQLQDLVFLAQAYGSRLGDSNWNPNADIDGNGAVGLSDLVALAQHYGQHYP